MREISQIYYMRGETAFLFQMRGLDRSEPDRAFVQLWEVFF